MHPLNSWCHGRKWYLPWHQELSFTGQEHARTKQERVLLPGDHVEQAVHRPTIVQQRTTLTGLNGQQRNIHVEGRLICSVCCSHGAFRRNYNKTVESSEEIQQLGCNIIGAGERASWVDCGWLLGGL